MVTSQVLMSHETVKFNSNVPHLQIRSHDFSPQNILRNTSAIILINEFQSVPICAGGQVWKGARLNLTF